MTAKKINVMIVDDHMVVRRGVRLVLQTCNDIDVVAEADSGEQALLLCRQHHPDVVLMDVKMDGIGGIVATRSICRHYPHTRIIVLSTFAEQKMIEQMKQAGAMGYLLKDASAQEIVAAIRAVHAGKSVPAPPVKAAPEAAATAPISVNTNLSKRQKEVLSLLAAGCSNEEIATQLTISHATARYHVSAILTKLGVANRAKAVALALKYGLIKP